MVAVPGRLFVAVSLFDNAAFVKNDEAGHARRREPAGSDDFGFAPHQSMIFSETRFALCGVTL